RAARAVMDGVVVEDGRDAAIGLHWNAGLDLILGIGAELKACRTIDPSASKDDRAAWRSTGNDVDHLVPGVQSLWHRTPEIERSVAARIADTGGGRGDRRDGAAAAGWESR